MNSLLTTLLLRVADTGFKKLKESKDFNALQRLAHERIGRELFWNLECMSSRKANDQIIYLSLLRTEAFDELVKLSAPLDDIFDAQVVSLVGPLAVKLPQQLRRRLMGINQLSMLLDRTYHRIWMLRHRVENKLALGDLTYLRQLIKLSKAEISRNRPGFAEDGIVVSHNPGFPPTQVISDEKVLW